MVFAPAIAFLIIPCQALANGADGRSHKGDLSLLTLRSQVAALASALTTLQEQHEAELAELQAELDAMRSEVDANTDSVLSLEDEMGALEDLSTYVTVDTATHDVVFSGANVHVRSGSGATDDNGSLTGLGNLIVGYDENGGDDDKSGSHNLVIGIEHTYSSYGGLVAGWNNAVTGRHSSVTGGYDNEATGLCSSISGGLYGDASAEYTSVTGGVRSHAEGTGSSVTGGVDNTASGRYSSVTGGSDNEATALYSSVTGGLENQANAHYSSVTGGYEGQANGEHSTVTGGRGANAAHNGATVTGGWYQTSWWDYHVLPVI